MFTTRHFARLGVAGGLVAGSLFMGASAASAHVTVEASSTASGSHTVLTFSNPHGCDGSPTTGVAIAIPEGINSVTPTRHADYTVEKVMETLDEPIDDGHGGHYTERVAQVVYTASDPLPDGYRDAFELSLQLPDGEAGDVLTFPVIQTCTEGETAWIDEPVEGEPEPETPAPAITLTAPGDGDGHGSAEGSATDESASTNDSSNALAWTGVVLGGLGLIAGGAAFVRSGSRS